MFQSQETKAEHTFLQLQKIIVLAFEDYLPLPMDIPPNRKSNMAASASGPGSFAFSSDGETVVLSEGSNGPAVATSGNAHAYSSDGDQLGNFCKRLYF